MVWWGAAPELMLPLAPVSPLLPIEPLSPAEPLVPMPPWPLLLPGVLPGGLTAGEVVAFGSMVGDVGPEPLLLGCIG